MSTISWSPQKVVASSDGVVCEESVGVNRGRDTEICMTDPRVKNLRKGDVRQTKFVRLWCRGVKSHRAFEIDTSAWSTRHLPPHLRA